MIIATITSKLILNRSCKRMGMEGSQGFPVPDKQTAVQFAVGTVVALLMWTAGILKRPKVSGAQVNITNSFGFSSFYNLVN